MVPSVFSVGGVQLIVTLVTLAVLGVPLPDAELVDAVDVPLLTDVL